MTTATQATIMDKLTALGPAGEDAIRLIAVCDRLFAQLCETPRSAGFEHGALGQALDYGQARIMVMLRELDLEVRS
jgi:hypothetical protein